MLLSHTSLPASVRCRWSGLGPLVSAMLSILAVKVRETVRRGGGQNVRAGVIGWRFIGNSFSSGHDGGIGITVAPHVNVGVGI